MSRARPCPEVRLGGMLRTRPAPTRIVCKVYSAPPGEGGEFLVSLPQGTVIGPVQEVRWQHGFLSVRIEIGWVNVYSARRRRPVHFAFVEQ